MIHTSIFQSSHKMQINKNQRNAIKENEEINKKIAQMKGFLENVMIRNENDVAWMIERIDNINYKVLETSYLKSNHAEWIGSTVLHFAAGEDLEAFNILLDCGADFTIQNNDSLTVLHKIIIDDSSNFILKKFTLTDPYVSSVLAAHLNNNDFQNPINKDGLSHFHIACAANNLEVVRGFINSGVPIDDSVKIDSSFFAGFSPLHFAAKFGACEVADVLLSHGADVHLKDSKGLTSLHVALERKIEIISNTDSSDPVRETNEKILKMLLNKEKNNSTLTIDNYGLSHLHVSCALKGFKVAERCLQNHENINSIINKDSPSWPGYTPLHFAALCNINTVKLLTKRGADMNIKNAKGLTPFDVCIERYKPQEIYGILSLKPIWKNILLSDGKTKLLDLVAAMRSHDNFNKFLRRITKKVIISLPGESPLWPGCTPMHLAVIFTKTSIRESVAANLEILKILFKQCPSMLQHQDIHGHTPVHLAFRLNKKLVLELLMEFLQECPNLIDQVDEDGLSFVHIASAKNQIVLLQRLLATGSSNVNAVYRGKSEFSLTIYRGSTALHFAVANGSAKSVDVLINFDADAYARDANGMTPIHLLLSGANRIKTGDILLSLPNLKDSIVSGTGLSHLHIASRWNKHETVERLLENGADINSVITVQATSTNEESNRLEFIERFVGQSPLLMASRAFNTATISVLVKRRADCFTKNDNGSPWLYSLVEDGNIYRHLLAYWSWFAYAFNERYDVQARVKADTGMSALHVACFCRNIEAVQKCLSEGANVDEQIRSNSPILQGYTPLHIVICTWKMYDADVNKTILNVLLKAATDVTLQSSDSKTVIHMAYELVEPISERYSVVNMLLEAQQDFSVNPTAVGGISHFLIACNLCNTSIVENFLNCDDLDVNQTTDYFHNKKPGYSALHLVAGSQSELCGKSKQLYTLDILLKHGADVSAEDSYGETPLHECARSFNSIDSLDLFERLARVGSDVDARNIYGQTAMDIFLKSDRTCAGIIRNLLRFGCRFNSFNNVDGSGCVGRMSNLLSYADLRSLICAVNVNFAREMEVDSVGRTVIHNLVSTVESKMLPSEYPELIEHMSRAGHDVDDQDKSGRTALHMAAKFHNYHAVSGLLMTGADINILDSYSKTAFASIFDSCINCECNDDFDEDSQMCKHQKTIATLAKHINKLKIFELYVSKQNEDLALEVCKKFERQTALSENIFKELENAKTTRIGSCTLTLHDFLSENGAIAGFPRMFIEKRQAVINVFSPSEMPGCREKFPELAGILQLQYRKARARPQLVESAQNALTVFAGFRLPEICSDFILIFLRNSDLKNLIASTTYRQ